MGKLETPITWILAILVLGYFIIGNCCKAPSGDQKNNGFFDKSFKNGAADTEEEAARWLAGDKDIREVWNLDSLGISDSVINIMFKNLEQITDSNYQGCRTITFDKNTGEIIQKEIETEDSELNYTIN